MGAACGRHAPWSDRMDRMSEAEIASALEALPEWSESGGEINRTYQLKDFIESMKFVNAIAAAAEADQHHPDILVRWNKVRLSLSTHDAGGITEKDFAMAIRADSIAVAVAPSPQRPAPGAGSKSPKSGTRSPRK